MKKKVFLVAALFALMAAVLPAQNQGQMYWSEIKTTNVFNGGANDGINGIAGFAMPNSIGFVGVGSGGKIGFYQLMMPALAWTSLSSPFGTTDIEGIAAGRDRMVAVGKDGKISFSAGITEAGVKTWYAVADSTFGNTRIRGVCWGNDKFIAVGEGNKIAYSADGIMWTAVRSPFGNNSRVIWGKDKFVVVCDGGTAYSADGINWTAATSNPLGNVPIISIAYGNNKFVVGTSPGTMAYSEDGITWTAVTDSTFGSSRVRVIAYADGPRYFFAAGDGGKIAYSRDGITWRARSEKPFATTDILSMCVIQSSIFLGGMAGKSQYTGTGGVAW